jgi:hypothetical protein
MAVFQKIQQQIGFSLSLLFLGLSVSLGACSKPETDVVNTGDRSPAVSNSSPSLANSTVQPSANQPASNPTSSSKAVNGQTWTQINRGQTAQELQLTQEGGLSYQGTTLLPTIPVSYSSDGSVTDALQLMVSPTSPSGRYNFFKACDRDGMCWAVYLVDRTNKTAKKVDVAKYGGRDWVQWSADERYAVLAEQMEGSTWMVAVDLPAAKSAMSDELTFTADLTSFKWTGDRTFTIQAANCKNADCKPPNSSYQANIEDWFTQ